MELKNKIIFITGGGGYIGRAVAYKLAALGAAVAVSDINIETAQETVKNVKEAGGRAIALAADVTKSESIDAAEALAADEFGGLDGMIHIAGGSARSKIKPLVDQTDDVIESILNVNLLGAIYASRAAARVMIKQGRGGRIINFSSAVGLNGLKGCVDYAAAKGGVMSMIKALAKELGEYKITVNSIAPGIVKHPETKGGNDLALNTNLLHEKCTPEDIAELTAFLVSDNARFITGQTYVIDGGRSLSMKGTD